MADEAGAQESKAFSLATPSCHKRTRTLSSNSAKPFLSTAEVLPETICRVCLNLGNEVWDPSYREKHGLGECKPHHIPVSDVAITAEEGCSGCKIIAWALEPYMERLQKCGGQVDVHFRSAVEDPPGQLAYFIHAIARKGELFRVALIINRTPTEDTDNFPTRANSE